MHGTIHCLFYLTNRDRNMCCGMFQSVKSPFSKCCMLLGVFWRSANTLCVKDIIRDVFLSFTKKVFSNPNRQISMHARKVKFALESRTIIQQSMTENRISIGLFVLEQFWIKVKSQNLELAGFSSIDDMSISYCDARDDLLPFTSQKQCQEMLWKTVLECQKCIFKCFMCWTGS